jgi:hypothetical protein
MAAREKPFLACFVLARRSGGKTLDASTFPGLVAAYTAVDGATSKLVSYWATREDYERSGKEVYETVGATSCVAEHHVIHYREPRRPFWKKIPWYTTLVTILAVVGAVSNFRGEIRNLTLAPEVNLSLRPGAPNYLVGDPIDESLSVTNRRPVTERISVTRAEIVSSGAATSHPLSFSPTAFGLPENQTESVRFRTTILAPGKYEIQGSLQLEAGRFADEVPRPFSIPFQVWSASPVLEEPEPKIEKRAKTKAELESVLLLGTSAADGVLCIVRIHRHPQITRVFSTFPGAKALVPWKVQGPAGAEVGSVTILLPRVPTMKPNKFRLELISAAETDWDDVVKNLEIDFRLPSTGRIPCDDSSSS